MKKSLILLALALPVWAQDKPALPPAADLALKAYDRDVAAARERAIRALQAVMTDETRRGKLDSALAVKQALENLSGSLATASTNGAPSTTTQPPKIGKVVIQANTKLGAELGSFRTGQHLGLEYMEGKWAMSGEKDPLKWVSPDEATYVANNLGIYAIENGEARLLAPVPTGTKRHTFHYRFEKDCPLVILRIQDAIPGDNPGYAVYNVTVSQ